MWSRRRQIGPLRRSLACPLATAREGPGLPSPGALALDSSSTFQEVPRVVKFQLEIGDRVRTVEVVPDPAGYRVLVDGQPRTVQVSAVTPGTWSLIVDDGETTARSVEVAVVPQAGRGAVHVHLEGHAIPVRLQDGLGRRGRGGDASAGVGPQRIVAPMPGKVVRILATVGDEVKARQGLVVVEAMKMENELRAARAGRVAEVLVREGQSVDAGSPLVVVE